MTVEQVKSSESWKMESPLIYIRINKRSDTQRFFRPFSRSHIFSLIISPAGIRGNHLSSVGADRQMKQANLTARNSCQFHGVRCRVYAYDRDSFQFLSSTKLFREHVPIPKGWARISFWQVENKWETRGIMPGAARSRGRLYRSSQVMVLEAMITCSLRANQSSTLIISTKYRTAYYKVLHKQPHKLEYLRYILGSWK